MPGLRARRLYRGRLLLAGRGRAAVSDLTGGEPEMQECDDPIQCCDPRCDGQWHPCAACNGTGLAKHQVIW